MPAPGLRYSSQHLQLHKNGIIPAYGGAFYLRDLHDQSFEQGKPHRQAESLGLLHVTQQTVFGGEALGIVVIRVWSSHQA